METLVSRTNIDTFVIWSGDSDFAPLASRLREHGKTVLGCGLGSSAASFRQTCDEFFLIRSHSAKAGEDEGATVPLHKLSRRACRTLAAKGSGGGEWVHNNTLVTYLTRLQPDVRSCFECRWSEYLRDHGRFELWWPKEADPAQKGAFWVRVMSKCEAEAANHLSCKPGTARNASPAILAVRPDSAAYLNRPTVSTSLQGRPMNDGHKASPILAGHKSSPGVGPSTHKRKWTS